MMVKPLSTLPEVDHYLFKRLASARNIVRILSLGQNLKRFDNKSKSSISLEIVECFVSHESQSFAKIIDETNLLLHVS